MNLIIKSSLNCKTSTVVALLIIFIFIKKITTGQAQQFIVILELLVVSIAILYYVSKDGLLRIPSKFLILLFLSYIAFGMIGPIINETFNVYTIIQTVLNLKIFLLLLYLYNSSRSTIFSEKFLLFVLIINTVLILFEMLFTGLYSSLFPGTTVGSVVPGTSILRYSGLFNHPGQLALFAFVIFTSSLCNKTSKYTKYITYLSFVGIILAMQRPELIFSIALIALYTCYRLEIKSRSLIASIAILTALTISIIASNKISSILISNFGVFVNTSGQLLDMAPRTALLLQSVTLANQYFPFGTGFATFGSGQSINNPENVYHLTSLIGIWWFENGMYYFDFFWGSVISETGYFGFLSLSLFVVILMFKLITKNPYYNKRKIFNFHNLVLYLLCFYFILNSLGTPIINGSILQLFLLLFLIKNLKVS
ncbi:hypothetical protein [Alteromonas gilva]|uniref:Uncharacterized protein n=1 Tax=Alteromonas gilva TaxID=2987522 RepID=A0ABT5KZ60_9ALTE|nr:hypothetical protein [Alteromonas gilva]MDC8829556.1 hypothetical protein [Alteromonas gilva]